MFLEVRLCFGSYVWLGFASQVRLLLQQILACYYLLSVTVTMEHGLLLPACYCYNLNRSWLATTICLISATTSTESGLLLLSVCYCYNINRECGLLLPSICYCYNINRECGLLLASVCYCYTLNRAFWKLGYLRFRGA